MLTQELTKHKASVAKEMRKERLRVLEKEKESQREDAETRLKLEKARAEEQTLLGQLAGEQQARKEAIQERRQLEVRAALEIQEQQRRDEGLDVLDLSYQRLNEVPRENYVGKTIIRQLHSVVDVSLRGNRITVSNLHA